MRTPLVYRNADGSEWKRAARTCVICPACNFTFAETHTVEQTGEYSCPACNERRSAAPGPSDETPEGRGIYIASKTKHAAQWLALRADGVPIISTWIDEAGPGQTADWSDLWRRCVAEARSCANCIVYAENNETLRGALVEAGAALGAGRHVILVSDKADVGSFFHHANVTRVDTIDEALSLALVPRRQ